MCVLFVGALQYYVSLHRMYSLCLALYCFSFSSFDATSIILFCVQSTALAKQLIQYLHNHSTIMLAFAVHCSTHSLLLIVRCWASCLIVFRIIPFAMPLPTAFNLTLPISPWWSSNHLVDPSRLLHKNPIQSSKCIPHYVSTKFPTTPHLQVIYFHKISIVRNQNLYSNCTHFPAISPAVHCSSPTRSANWHCCCPQRNETIYEAKSTWKSDISVLPNIQRITYEHQKNLETHHNERYSVPSQMRTPSQLTTLTHRWILYCETKVRLELHDKRSNFNANTDNRRHWQQSVRLLSRNIGPQGTRILAWESLKDDLWFLSLSKSSQQ